METCPYYEALVVGSARDVHIVDIMFLFKANHSRHKKQNYSYKQLVTDDIMKPLVLQKFLH